MRTSAAPTRRRAPERKARASTPTPKPSTWYMLVGLIAVLVVIGLVMVLSASSVQSEREFGSTWSYFLRQSIWAAIGLVALTVAARVDYRRWRPLIPLLLFGSLALLLVVLVPGFGNRVSGAQSWLVFGPVRVQPSELVKLALLLFCADLLAKRASLLDNAAMTLGPVIIVVGFTSALMLAQPDLGSLMVMATIVLSVLFVAGVPLANLFAVFSIGAAASLMLALSETYRRNRLLAYLDPSSDPSNTSYQINQSLMGMATGRIFGVGLGESRAKWGFLPNAHTDFIFAIIAEELGLIGALLVIGLFLGIAVFGTRAALHAPDRFGMLVASGITAWILAQAFVNIGGVVGILPITGLTLPFVSFGGTSLVVTMGAAGLLLNVAANGRSRV